MTNKAFIGQPEVSDREIVSRRVFDAPREKLFRAWTEPERLARWWGPKGFTNTFETFDFRPGGVWRFVMHGPDGANYPNESVFVEVLAAERIVLDHVVAPRFRMTMTLTPEGGNKTALTWRMAFETAEECGRLKPICVPANEENFDRLAAELARADFQ